MIPIRLVRALAILAGTSACILFGAGSASAQGYGGGTAYVPYGGAGGGFVPYTPGPAGGLGVQPAMPRMGRASERGIATMGGGMRQELGQIRSLLTPPGPVTTMRPASGMGMGTLIQRSPSGRAGAAMGGMGGRPAVGSYPFRQPPSLVSPAAPAMGMGM